MEPMQWKLASSHYDFGYTEKFCIPGVRSVFFSSFTVWLGTLWSSIKQIEAPYVFDWENAIALDTRQGNRASSRREGKVSWVFSSCDRHLGYILEIGLGRTLSIGVCLVKSGHLSRNDGHRGKLN